MTDPLKKVIAVVIVDEYVSPFYPLDNDMVNHTRRV
jgi:hypothetical protein